MIRFIARALGANYSFTFLNYFIMLPKSRNELREIFEKLREFNEKEDILRWENFYLKQAMKYILRADYYVSHTGKSHKQLKALEDENA